MQFALDQFNNSITRVRDLIALHNNLNVQVTNAVDLSDLLRSAIVLTVSALDYYIHEVVVLGMLEIYRGQRPEPRVQSNTSRSAFSRFQISLGSASQDRLITLDLETWLENEILQDKGLEFLQESHLVSSLIPILSSSLQKRIEENLELLETEIREQLSYQSFQQPDKIVDAINIIWNKPDKKGLWDQVGYKMNKTAKEIRQQLTSIIDRRNKIAHEADIDPGYGIGNRWDIEESFVTDAINFIEEVVHSIDNIIR